MKEKVGEVFSIAKENSPVPGCTISKEVHSGENYITYFSLVRNTDISAEIYPYHKLLIVADGSMEVYGAGGLQKKLEAGDSIVTYVKRRLLSFSNIYLLLETRQVIPERGRAVGLCLA